MPRVSTPIDIVCDMYGAHMASFFLLSSRDICAKNMATFVHPTYYLLQPSLNCLVYFPVLKGLCT